MGSANRKASKAQQTSRRCGRGLTCANCRARKVRCEGSQPTCKTCEVYHDECRYDKAPPISQVIAMAKRLQEAEDVIAELRAKVDTTSPSSLQINITPQDGHLHNALDGTGTPSTPYIPISGSEFLPEDQTGDTAVHTTSKVSTAADLSVDEHGEIQYYGPTSAVHDPPQIDLPVPQALSSHPNVFTRADARSALAAQARESAIWEEFALGNASLQTGIPRQVLAKLLHLHWTWVSPMFMWVYRPAFIRDMAIGGRYYSEFLLTVICAHAAKYQDGNCAEFLLARVRRLLGTAIQQPSSIPTVQALLQLSARELASGSISQAWVYSGIAFRMASDLGLQHSVPDIKGLGPVDLEIRTRLFWSCFFWDKATSLYAGRLPAVTELLHHRTLDQLDGSTELEVWTPYHGDSLNLTKLSNDQYPLHKSYTVSCFANSCKLAIIINDVIIQLYSRRSRTVAEASLIEIKPRLALWRAQSPAHLRYDPSTLPAICPPPHIISQNLLYFTTVILAHRPFWSIPTYYQMCIEASQSIEKLVLLLESTFGLENITYLMGYCIYTGASAILEDATSSGHGSSHPILRTFLRALNAGMKRCPLLERSLNIIVKRLNRIPVQPSLLLGNHSQADDIVPTYPWIPAFPYVDPAISIDFNMNPYLKSGNMNSMAVLDCYPEIQMDTSEMVCPL
ncbi:fungal-specific transcription factor domain-containing protein [Bisporella sp. PMI_857]|nr:fungal-specific transcription factor domain-containing protein [Bisporella sp. PMI_857]